MQRWSASPRLRPCLGNQFIVQLGHGHKVNLSLGKRRSWHLVACASLIHRSRLRGVLELDSQVQASNGQARCASECTRYQVMPSHPRRDRELYRHTRGRACTSTRVSWLSNDSRIPQPLSYVPARVHRLLAIKGAAVRTAPGPRLAATITAATAVVTVAAGRVRRRRCYRRRRVSSTCSTWGLASNRAIVRNSNVLRQLVALRPEPRVDIVDRLTDWLRPVTRSLGQSRRRRHRTCRAGACPSRRASKRC